MTLHINVYYLARKAEGWAHFERFAKSYRQFDAGIEHELYIIAKGFTKRTELYLLQEMFQTDDAHIIQMDDEIGQDIHAYKAAAKQRESEYVCFLNTFSRINAEGWLSFLYAAIKQTDVGLAGATGSFESLLNTYAVIDEVAARIHAPVRFDRHFVEEYAWVIEQMSPATFKASQSQTQRLRRFVGDTLRQGTRLNEYVRPAGADFRSHIRPEASFDFLKTIPSFPNPHIRSNAFITSRTDFLSAPLDNSAGKLGCVEFESGKTGFSNAILKSGRRIVVVGRDGRQYDIPDWPNSKAFRSGTETAPLISDNHTDNYFTFGPAERQTHDFLTWGPYLPGQASSKFGIPFDNLLPLNDFLPKNDTHKQQSSPRFSIVIPTHDRNKLVLDAIYSVVSQDYKNWEVVIFDNASTRPVCMDVTQFEGYDIRVDRSEEKLAVTDSWKRAFAMATGDYVIMLGDDDSLCPDYFSRTCELIDKFGNPDVVFSSLIQFYHPGVHPAYPEGRTYLLPTSEHMSYRGYPFELPKKLRHQQVDNSLGFSRTFHFNMPAITASRAFLETLEQNGSVLQPPFPDYYYANLLFEKAEKLVIDPRPNAFQGISRKSFGFTLINQKTEEGFKVLGHQITGDQMYPSVKNEILPGDEYMAHYLLTMTRLAGTLGDPDRVPDTDRYRRIAALDVIKKARHPVLWMNTGLGKAIFKHLSFKERIWSLKAGLTLSLAHRFPRHWAHPKDRLLSKYNFYPFAPFNAVLDEGNFIDGTELYDALRSGRIKIPVY